MEHHNTLWRWRYSSRVGSSTHKPIPAIYLNPQAHLQLFLSANLCAPAWAAFNGTAPLDPPCSCCKVALPEGRFLGETLHATLTQELFDCHGGRTVAAPFAGVYQRNRQRLLVVDMHNGLRVCIVLQSQACAKTPLSKIFVEYSEH